jgi:hypothetical protein
MPRFVGLFLCFASFLALGACHPATSPQLRVLGAHDHEVVFVQVTNPAPRPMRLTKLEYTFAADGAKVVASGEMPLEREIPAGAAVVVEVPLDTDEHVPMTLTGRLTAELDEMVRIFQVSAQVQPH